MSADLKRSAVAANWLCLGGSESLSSDSSVDTAKRVGPVGRAFAPTSVAEGFDRCGRDADLESLASTADVERRCWNTVGLHPALVAGTDDFDPNGPETCPFCNADLRCAVAAN